MHKYKRQIPVDFLRNNNWTVLRLITKRINYESNHSFIECQTYISDNGEFDPGSGRTLAVCLIHASRTRRESLLSRKVADG